jgi:hypothetical protein
MSYIRSSKKFERPVTENSRRKKIEQDEAPRKLVRKLPEHMSSSYIDPKKSS